MCDGQHFTVPLSEYLYCQAWQVSNKSQWGSGSSWVVSWQLRFLDYLLLIGDIVINHNLDALSCLKKKTYKINIEGNAFLFILELTVRYDTDILSLSSKSFHSLGIINFYCWDNYKF